MMRRRSGGEAGWLTRCFRGVGAAAGKSRYPGDAEEPTLEEVGGALGIGGRVYEAVVDLLPGEVGP